MRRKTRVFATLLATVLFCLDAAALDLAVRGRKPFCSIVIAADATEPYQSAANELRTFVKEMTDVELPILRDTAPLPVCAILIGPNVHSRKLLGAEYAPEKLEDDAFTLKVLGQHLVILGGKRGAQYGVYEVLERFGGCRWYASWHSVIPKQERFSVPSGLSETQKPAFLMREPFWYDMFNTYQAIRNKCNGNAMRLEEKHGGKIRFGGGLFVHTTGHLISPNEYFDSHPEYFSEINGKRLRNYSQLCFSNPDVLKIITKKVMDRIRKDPNGTMFSVSQNDWRNPCQCAKCQALVRKTGNQAGVLIWFVNQVAEAVEKEFPKVLIETLAYQYTREPPPNIKPRHNVVPRLCTIECDFSKPIPVSTYPQNVKFMQDIKGWAAITDKMFIWDYTTNFANYIGPFPNFAALQGNVKLFRDCHVVGVMEQGAYQGYHAEFAELRGWLLAKLLWNPDIDTKPLIDDFFQGYYGPAAPFVRKYFDELNSLVTDKNIALRIFDNMKVKWMTDDFLLRATALWNQAEAAVKDKPGLLYNVRKSAIPVYYARFERLPQEKINYEFNGDAFVPVNISRERVQLAKELLSRYEGPRAIRVCEGAERHNNIIASWKNAVEGHKAKMLNADGFKLGVFPSMDGIVGVLNGPDGYAYLDAASGGISSSLTLKANGNRLFKLGKCDDKCIRAGYDSHSYYHVDESFSLSAAGLSATYVFRNTSQRDITEQPTVSLALNLGIDANYAYRLDDGKWNDHVSPDDLLVDSMTFQKSQLAGKRMLTVASPKSARGVSILLPAELDTVFLRHIPGTGLLRLFLSTEQAIPIRGTLTLATVIKPLAKCHGLPPSRKAAPAALRRYIQEDNSMLCSRLGDWGDRVKDSECEDGSALRLNGTHFEWCLRGNVDYSILVPGIRYKLRMRIKVVKAQEKGIAFWAGIYDSTDKKGYGEIQPNVQDVKDGYQWYDVATWTPNTKHNQWIWAGPGIFDKKNGTSAIKAVYVDKLELVPASPAKP